MWTPARRALSAGRAVAAALACAAAACVPSRPATAVSSSPDVTGWVDSVLATLSPRDRAAQLVWPQVFGDFVPEQTASWDRVAKLVGVEHVGGFVLSIGSPIETASKLNAMQRMSRVPLLIGADYEAGAGYRSRGGF